MLRSWVKAARPAAAWFALVAAIVLPIGVIAQDISLSVTAKPGFFTGKWVYRSHSISSNPKDTLAKLSLGLNELVIAEQSNGAITGQRLGQGVTYDLTGQAVYASRVGATIRLTGQATVGGKLYNYDYYGYLMPSWGVGAVPDTIRGTVLRSDPEDPANDPLIASFSATRQ